MDVANRQIYWIDSDTISDCVVRVGFDNENFTVVFDRTPNTFASSGLGDLAIDFARGKLYFADEIPLSGNPVIQRCNLDGSGRETLYTAPEGAACVAICFDSTPPHSLEDCNHNGVPDRIDIASGHSQDCNHNGIPDECESNPCGAPNYLLNQGVNTAPAPRALGGGWEVFQPFDVPTSGWRIGEVQLDGWTGNYVPGGFTATIFPDNGSGMPDENRPLTSGATFFRFSEAWVKVPVGVELPAGRCWVRLTAQGNYQASVYVGTSGLNSFSRRNGNNYLNQPAIALRLLPPQTHPGDLNCDGAVNFDDINPFVQVLSDPAGWQQQYPGCPLLNGDCNGDGVVNFDDINAFVALLSGS